MNTLPPTPASGRRSADDDTTDRNERELDVVFALDPLDEAIDVAFLALKGAQQAARSMSDTAPAVTLCEEWRKHNVLLRQSLRLLDERVQELAKAVKRLPRIG
jgi:hypothetical protein